MDARRAAHQLRDLHPRPRGRHRPSGHPDRPRRRTGHPAGPRRRGCPWPTKARPPAAMRAARSIGSPTRRASPGSISIPWAISRCSTKRPAPRTAWPAAYHEPRAQPWAASARRRTPAAEAGHERKSLQRSLHLHRQLGALYPGRRLDEPARRRARAGVLRGQPAQRSRQPVRAGHAAPAAHPDRRLSQQELGRVRATGRTGAGLRLHGLRQRGRRSLPLLAGSAGDRALGSARPGRRTRHGRKQGQGLQRHRRRAEAAHRADAGAAAGHIGRHVAAAQTRRHRQGAG